MKAAGMWIALVLGIASGCGGDGDLASCAGDYQGAYTGEAAGTLTGHLFSAGTLDMTAQVPGTPPEAYGTGQVSDDGQLLVQTGSEMVFIGKLTFATCAMTGTWSYPTASADSGTWQMGKR